MCWKLNKCQSNESEARNLEIESVSSTVKHICVQNNSSPTCWTQSMFLVEIILIPGKQFTSRCTRVTEN